MGILNVTPDSFSDGGHFADPAAALARAHQMEDEGADFIDIGGESSRPGSQPISAAEELTRTMPIIEALAREIRLPLSIDTTKAVVARAALEAGASIVNDISALRGDEEMIRVVAEFDATVILMHMQGQPHNMQDNPHYDNLIGEIHEFFAERKAAALRAGIIEDRLIVDPGIGFGKRLGDNFECLRRLSEFGDLGAVLVGPSRKGFIGKTLEIPVEDRIFGTAGAAAVAVMNGADIIRVHDIKPMIHVAEIVHQCMTRTEPRENNP
jgi:dihydropteroate synthase